MKPSTVDPSVLSPKQPLYAVWHPTLGFYRDDWGRLTYGSEMKKSGTFTNAGDAALLLSNIAEKLERDLTKFRKEYPDGIRTGGRVCRTPTWYTESKRNLKDTRIVKVSLNVVDLK